LGIRRFTTVLAKDFWNLVKLNLIFCACALPSIALFVLAYLGVLGGFALVLSLIAAFPIGGAASAGMFCVTKMLRDDPGYLWHDFKRKYTENMKQAMAPGILSTLFLYAQIYLWRDLTHGGADADLALIVMGALSILIFGMVAPYIFVQIAYIELATSKIIKNSVLISFANSAYSFLGALMGFAVWIAFALFLPESLLAAPVLLVLGFSMSWLLNLLWIWPAVDKQFSIEKTLRSRRDRI